ncbi:hypothetical protein GsuE55_22410 [Geobacillus subterraneus]|uniref:Uncharacterized protein n=1 Tax=Geobacillus subterraneus TaxID=129338 RepID=A0A679FM12_9BACL|nr:hypothetical protein GsuE55_22410 [Geobacillus subterraneus]
MRPAEHFSLYDGLFYEMIHIYKTTFQKKQVTCDERRHDESVGTNRSALARGAGRNGGKNR